LEKAETNEVISIGQGQAATFINQSATQVCQRSWINIDQQEERALREYLFSNACELAKEIRAYKLRINMNGRFWEKIEEVLS
jgi:SynChlorMet cassette protein ScmC